MNRVLIWRNQRVYHILVVFKVTTKVIHLSLVLCKNLDFIDLDPILKLTQGLDCLQPFEPPFVSEQTFNILERGNWYRRGVWEKVIKFWWPMNNACWRLSECCVLNLMIDFDETYCSTVCIFETQKAWSGKFCECNLFFSRSSITRLIKHGLLSCEPVVCLWPNIFPLRFACILSRKTFEINISLKCYCFPSCEIYNRLYVDCIKRKQCLCLSLLAYTSSYGWQT